MYFSPHWVINGQRTSSQFDAWRYARSLSSELMPHFYFFEETLILDLYFFLFHLKHINIKFVTQFKKTIYYERYRKS